MEHTHETKLRSTLKTFTWWLLVLFIDFSIIFFITKNTTQTLLVVFLTNCVGVGFYFIHERAWSKVFFGLRPHNKTDAD